MLKIVYENKETDPIYKEEKGRENDYMKLKQVWKWNEFTVQNKGMKMENQSCSQHAQLFDGRNKKKNNLKNR